MATKLCFARDAIYRFMNNAMDWIKFLEKVSNGYVICVAVLGLKASTSLVLYATLEEVR